MMRTIFSYCQKAYIIAHKERISLLSNALSRQGFDIETVRGPYTNAQKNYSSAIKCLVNHSNSWKLIRESKKPGLIVEADFVPVQNLCKLTLPAPMDKTDYSLIYLYACGPTFWDLANGCPAARGHAGSTVAYIISPYVASAMLDYFDIHLRSNSAGKYSTWDAEIGYWLKNRGIQSFIPLRHYGEHGGSWNFEHTLAGLRKPHRADVLAGPLEFIPEYANSPADYFAHRLYYFLYGLGRLICGRLLGISDIRRKGGLRLLSFVLARFICFIPLRNLSH